MAPLSSFQEAESSLSLASVLDSIRSHRPAVYDPTRFEGRLLVGCIYFVFNRQLLADGTFWTAVHHKQHQKADAAE